MPQNPEGSATPTAEASKSTVDILRGIKSAIDQFDQVSKLPAAQRGQAGTVPIGTVLDGVVELHKGGVIAENEKARTILQQTVFNNPNPAYRAFAEGLVARIETMASSSNPQIIQSVPSLLELSALLGINQTKYPDLIPRLAAIEIQPRIIRSLTDQGGTEQGRPVPPDQTPAAGGSGEGPRGPRPPEMGDKERKTSPERGRAIVNEIVRLEAGKISYSGRYKLKVADSTLGEEYLASHPAYAERNGIYLDQLYEDLQDHTRAIRRVRNIRDEQDPWNPIRAYEKIKAALGRVARGEQQKANQLGISPGNRGERPSVLPKESLNVLFDKYKDETNAEAVEGDMATWFQEARNFGLLDRADAFFTSFHKQVTQGNITVEQIEEELRRVREHAKGSIEGLLRSRRTDPRVAPLRGIAEAYTTRTYDIFDLWLSGERYVPIKGEFRFSEDLDEVEDTEKYWRPGHYPKLYEIIAKTKKQFNRAKDSFLSMITQGVLGESPGELYEHFNNFTEKFRQTAGSQGIENRYIMNSVYELGGSGFVFGGDYSFETYDIKSADQFLMAMALHKGPQRWIAVARSGNGGVAKYLWKFDYDPRVKLMHNPGGTRGQLLNDTVTQHYLHAQIRDILIEEGMGIVLKDYDPRDADSVAYSPGSIRVLNIPEAEQQRERALVANVERIGIHQPVEEFKGLYEGFDTGNAHLVNYQRYQDLDETQLKTLSPNLRRSVIIGKVQSLLLPHDEKEKDQLATVIDELIVGGRLTARDKRFWEEAYGQSKANFATAFQMIGATGEKARRGGGVFFIDRKDEHGRRFAVDNMPVYLGEMFIQYAENRAKIEYSDESSIWDRKDGFNERLKETKNEKQGEPGFIEVTYKDGKTDKLRTKAAYRAYMVRLAREGAIDQIKTNGFEANLTFPKLRFNTDENSPNYGDVIGMDGSETQTIDFETATDPKNPLNKWLNHTYLSYQPENRHQVTNPDVLRAAKRRRMRLLRPDLMAEPESEEDQHENLADIRLILDPTLNRVPSLQDTDMPEGMSAQQAEILLSDATVEASNIGHWRIVRELNAEFMSKDGNPFTMRTGYNLEDYGGIARFIIRMRQFVASNPKRFARRYASEIANLPLNISSMSDQWGQAGVLGAIEMFADPIEEMSEQRIAGQFAITKWVTQMKIGNMIYEALVGHVDSEKGFSVEGLFEKPTNNAERIAAIRENLTDLDAAAKQGSYNIDAELKFMNLILESFGRLDLLLKLVRTMESDTRNAQGALDLEDKDILKDGKVDLDILNDLAKDRNTGSSRHTEEQFFYAYIEWLTKGAGVEAYKGENQWYKKLLDKTILDPDGKMSRADWLFNKMVR